MEQRQTILGFLGSLHAINRALKHRARIEHGDSLALLTVLTTVASPGRARASDLADQLMIDLSSMSRRLSALEAQGLIKKVVDEGDRRAQLVALTADGRDLLHSLRQNAVDRMSGILSDWSQHDLDQLSRLLLRLEGDLAAAEGEQATSSLALSGK